MKYYLSICFLFLSMFVWASNDILVLKKETLNVTINASLKVAEDATGQMTLEKALMAGDKFKFPKDNQLFHFGLTKSTFWIKGKIQNNHDDEKYILYIDDPSLTSVEIYVLNAQNEQILYSKSGAKILNREQLIKGNSIAFPIQIPKNQVVQIFLKISTNSFMTIPIKIKEVEEFQTEVFSTSFFLGIFYGLMLLMILYNLLGFFVSKEDLLIYFTLSVLFFTAGVGTYDGMLSAYLPWTYKYLNYSPESFLISIGMAFSILFTKSFLNVPNQSQLSDILKVLSGFFFINTLVSLLNPIFGIHVLIGLVPLYIMMAIWGFVWAYQKKIAMAKYLMVANLFLIVGACINLSAMFGLLASPWWNNYGLHIGYMLYILTISFGIAGKLNRMRLEVVHKENQILKEKAKKDVEREKNVELEKVVKERTLVLTQQNDELVKLNAELDRFVYSISHELSSPLKSLIGLIQLMKQDKDPDSLAIYLEMQEKSIQKLDLYTRELTDLLRNARIDVQKQSIHFRELLNEVLNQRKSDLGYDKVKKIISIKQDVPFASDKNRLAVLLGNLISNGIQYYRQGIQSHLKIQIEVNAEKALVTVSDNGQGIGREHLEKVFQMFYRASEKSQGSGLGLYIVKETITKLNGKIDMHSEINIGTIFKIEIPNLAEPEHVSVAMSSVTA